MDFFVKHWKVNRSGTLMMLAFQLGLFLMGVVMVLGINAFLNNDQDYAAIGGMMALMATVMGGLARGSAGMIRYRLAVSMGYTRRAYMLVDPVLTLMNCIVGVVFAWVLNQLELRLYAAIYPGWEVDLDIFSVMEWWHCLVLILGVCLLDFLFGALLLRFGTKGFAAMWFPLCFLPLIIMKSADAAKDGGTSLLAQIGRSIAFLIGLLSPAMWCAAGILLALALLVLSALCYGRAEIKA